MNFLPDWNWLRRTVTETRRSSQAAQDAADMGTAFGLDASMADSLDPHSPAAGPDLPPCLSRRTGLPRTR